MAGQFVKLVLQTVSARSRYQTVRSWSMYAVKPREKPRLGIAAYSMMIIPVTAFGLGCWQVQRRKWKLGLIEMLESRTNAAPIPLPNDLNELEDLEYRKVNVSGTFDHSKEVYLGPRSLLTEETSSSIHQQKQTGYLVITPFHLSDRDLTILINRGWVSKKQKNPLTRSEGQIAGEVVLVGLVRHGEKRPNFTPKNQLNSLMFYHRDLDQMAQLCGTAPILLDADASSSLPGGPIGGQTNVTLRNEHLSYIVTWFTLSVLTSYQWYKRFYKKLWRSV